MLKFSLFVLMIFVVITPSTASAERSGWMSGNEIAKIPGIRKKLIIAIDCRDTYRPGLQVRNFEYNVTYTNNPSKKKFHWAIGSAYGRFKIKSEKKGYKLVSFKQFTRKNSGLKIRCAVWHER